MNAQQKDTVLSVIVFIGICLTLGVLFAQAV